MRYILLILFIPQFMFAQMSKAKALRKLKLQSENLVTAEETITLYPRVLIYSVNNPNTIGYLSCIGSNQREFDAFFNEKQKSIRLAVGQKNYSWKRRLSRHGSVRTIRRFDKEDEVGKSGNLKAFRQQRKIRYHVLLESKNN